MPVMAANKVLRYFPGNIAEREAWVDAPVRGFVMDNLANAKTGALTEPRGCFSPVTQRKPNGRQFVASFAAGFQQYAPVAWAIFEDADVDFLSTKGQGILFVKD